MRVLILILGVVLAGCSQPQPGCTPENCKLLASACYVEFQGGPADVAACTGIDRPTTPPDFSTYCVNACNAHPGSGQVASCLAGKADACRSARADGGLAALDLVISSCATSTDKGPEQGCGDRCTAQRRTCDDACSGGKACDSCLRAGKDCRTLCADAGYKVCLDCSAQCGLKYIGCSDQCPRAQ